MRRCTGPILCAIWRVGAEVFGTANREEVWCDGDDDVVGAAEDGAVERPEVWPEIDEDGFGTNLFCGLQDRAVDGGLCAQCWFAPAFGGVPGVAEEVLEITQEKVTGDQVHVGAQL